MVGSKRDTSNDVDCCALLYFINYISTGILCFVSFILFIVSMFEFTRTEDNGCYSFICNNWNLKEFIIKRYVNESTIEYNPICNCNYCVITDECECSLLKCIIITQQNNI